MKLTSLDLEMNQPSGKIIQIGAVIGDTETGEISQRLRIYVYPGETINPEITTLCGITQDELTTKGMLLDDAYLLLKDFHKTHSDFINPVTWGGGDSQEVFEQLNSSSKEDWCFGRRWIDAKTLFVSRTVARNNRVYSGGLNSSMKRVGLKFEGRQHDAQDDAENTFIIYHHMLKLIRDGKF